MLISYKADSNFKCSSVLVPLFSEYFPFVLPISLKDFSLPNRGHACSFCMQISQMNLFAYISVISFKKVDNMYEITC